MEPHRPVYVSLDSEGRSGGALDHITMEGAYSADRILWTGFLVPDRLLSLVFAALVFADHKRPSFISIPISPSTYTKYLI